MLDQAVPIGINLTSPTTWFVVAVALIVVAITLSTRRSNIRPNSGLRGAQIEPLASAAPERYTDEWSSAQALFVEDPRAGCERARAIVSRMLEDRGFRLETTELRDTRYAAASEIVSRSDTSTDELRHALMSFRSIADALVSGTYNDRT